ncbi:MAG: serine--tRNA ligase, partial [Actinomycetota bacterium]
MLDLKLVREDPERVKAALAKRGPGMADQVDRLLEADAARRRLVTEVDALRAQQKRRGKEVARATPEERERLLAGLKELSARLDEAEARQRAAEAELAELQARIPNLPDPATPAGGEEDSVEL